MTDKPVLIRHLRWLNEDLQIDGPNRVVARAFRHLAEDLIDAADIVTPELERALEQLVVAHDAAQRVATLAYGRSMSKVMDVLVDGPEIAAVPPVTPGHNTSTRLS